MGLEGFIMLRIAALGDDAVRRAPEIGLGKNPKEGCQEGSVLSIVHR